MTKRMGIWISIATVLVLFGCILLGVVMMEIKWDFSGLSTVTYETNTYRIADAFTHVTVITDTADVTLVPSEEDIVSVVCYENVRRKHTVSVNDGTLTIESTDTRKWYEHIGINFGAPKITVYLPRGVYGALQITVSTGDVDISAGYAFTSADIAVSTGDIAVQGMTADTLNLSVSTGKVTLSSVTCAGDVGLRVTTGKATLTDLHCRNFTTNGKTGAITLNDVIATEGLTIRRTTGDVRFTACDAATVTVRTDTGNVKGSLLSDKVFMTHTSTGRVRVPTSVTGGTCTVSTTTGDITITIE